MANSLNSLPWTAPEGCVAHHRGLIERHVNSMPALWRQEPAVGEVFESRKDAEARLQVFSLIQGFDVVGRGGGNAESPGIEIRCIHHGNITRNDRGLEDKVVRDREGNIITQRKREGTNVRQTGCSWRVRIAFTMINKKDESQGREWRLTKVSLTHQGHDLLDNPLAAYPTHRKRIPEFQEALVKATAHRSAKIVYSASRRILESEDFALHLSSREFYNTLRKQRVEGDDKSVLGFIAELQDKQWICETRSEVLEDKQGNVIGRKLIQAWFTHPKLMSTSQRFISDFCLIIDGTFNTNRLKLPLLVAVGQLNSGKTFPIGFSWCPEEDEASYTFFWKCFKDHCFTRPFEPSCAPPRVIIGDQSKGLTASIPGAFPDAKQQFCDWHVVQAMEKKMRDLGTPWDDIKSVYKAKCWEYIQSKTPEALTANRRALGQAVGPLFMKYLEETWIPKEQKVVYLYTHKNANLGATSSQRSESYHDTVRELTNAQLSLEESVKRLMMKINSVIKDIDQDEVSSAASYSRLAQSPPFRLLRLNVSKYAITHLEREWAALDAQIRGGQDVIIPPNGCECEILLRFGISCCHYLKKAYLEDFPIPKTLVHPRWWLNGPPIHSTNWVPFYPTPEPTPEALSTEISPSLITQLATLRGLLNPQERYLFDVESSRVERQIANYSTLSVQSLLRNTQRSYQLQQTPFNQPDPVRQGYLARRNPHGRANERSLISTEIADRQRRQERSRQLQQARQQETQATEQLMDEILDYTLSGPRPFEEGEDTIEIARQTAPKSIPESPPRSLPISLPIRTPERPRPRRSPSPELSPVINEPPASTTPAALGKRRRNHTTRFTEGRRQGFIAESQERQ
jgi:hypothetical protein